jgi:hypothetical protein
VVWDKKIVYMSVTKVACTSLRWMVADLAGEDLELFYSALGAQQTRLMTIHGDRTRWQRTPQLFQLSEQQLSEISRDNGWFIFAVVRDPWSRIWSAWQSKFLVRHTFYDRFQKEPWFPAVPSSQKQVIEDFHTFLEARPWTTDPVLSEDVHFLPQVHSVRPQGVNYSRVYDLGHLGDLFTDLKAHLASVGHPVDELYMPRANETPLPLIRPVFDDGAKELVEQLYAADFAEFGDRWDFEKLFRHGDSWSDDAISHAAYHTVANQRIGDLSKEARKLKRQGVKAKARADHERKRADELQAELDAVRARQPRALAARAAARARRDVAAWLESRSR